MMLVEAATLAATRDELLRILCLALSLLEAAAATWFASAQERCSYKAIWDQCSIIFDRRNQYLLAMQRSGQEAFLHSAQMESDFLAKLPVSREELEMPWKLPLPG